MSENYSRFTLPPAQLKSFTLPSGEDKDKILKEIVQGKEFNKVGDTLNENADKKRPGGS
ncbi:hypothetical protein [Candidatus Paracaedibacter symbiosus]|uniref:hypothetical protein n=1 Tax=Candidatus Paracaedibacter symbiosus TaxID=244582 RepID=UPI0012EB4C55|nr:hypothetical protein [Candidatus Paracaedibacter symbiosus]